MNLPLEHNKLFLHLGRKPTEEFRINADTNPLHPDQNRQQGHLHIFKERLLLLLGNHRQQLFVKTQGDISILGSIDRCFLDLDLVKANFLLATACNLTIADGAIIKQIGGQAVHAVGFSRRIGKIAGQHRIEERFGDLHPNPAQHQNIVLEILTDFQMISRAQQRADCFKHLIERQLVRDAEITMTYRYIPSLTRSHSEREPYQIDTQGIQTCRLGIKSKSVRALQCSDHLHQIRFIQHSTVALAACTGT